MRFVWAVAIGACVLWTAYVAMRLRATYQLQTEYAKLHSEFLDLQLSHDRDLQDAKQRLNYLEEVLFGEVLAKIDKKQKVVPMRIEPWLANSIKDLRDRVTVLERSRIEKSEQK